MGAIRREPLRRPLCARARLSNAGAVRQCSRERAGELYCSPLLHRYRSHPDEKTPRQSLAAKKDGAYT